MLSQPWIPGIVHVASSMERKAVDGATILAAHLDLTVVPHPDAGEDVSSSDALHAVLFDSGRPVMIAPQKPVETIGKRVCIAWNGTAESASSVLAAMPWMQRADGVAILSAVWERAMTLPAG